MVKPFKEGRTVQVPQITHEVADGLEVVGGLQRTGGNNKKVPPDGPYPRISRFYHNMDKDSRSQAGMSPPYFNEAEVATDGTVLKTRNAGEYRIMKYSDPDAIQKKHLVVVITADVRAQEIALRRCPCRRERLYGNFNRNGTPLLHI